MVPSCFRSKLIPINFRVVIHLDVFQPLGSIMSRVLPSKAQRQLLENTYSCTRQNCSTAPHLETSLVLTHFIRFERPSCHLMRHWLRERRYPIRSLTMDQGTSEVRSLPWSNVRLFTMPARRSSSSLDHGPEIDEIQRMNSSLYGTIKPDQKLAPSTRFPL